MKYFGDIIEDAIIHIPFNTNDSDGASVTFTGTTVKVYKDSATGNESTAGVTLSKNHNAITGVHLVSINTSIDVFYSTGSDFLVQLESATIDGQVVSAWIGSFSIENRSELLGIIAKANLESQYDTTGLSGDTFPANQGQVGNLSTGSAGISTIATGTAASVPTVVGTPTSDHTATIELDGVYHSWVPGATLEFAYDFNIGANASPVSITWIGTCNSNNDAIEVYARNWVGNSWEQIGSIEGLASSFNREEIFILTTAHVNTGANSGDVRLRFESSGGDLVTAFATDRILCEFTITNQSVGYANGAIWVDENADNTNTVDFVDGVADNPVSTWAAAQTIATSVGMKEFHIANGTTITLDQAATNYTMTGDNWALVLAGFDITSAHVNGALVTGVSTGVGVDFHDCEIGDVTIASGDFFNCGLSGDIILSGASTYFFDRCYSGIAGTETPSIDFGDAIGNTNLNMRHYSGGIEIKEMGSVGNDLMSLEGWGQLIVNATCDGGTIAIRGNFTVTDNASEAVTLSDDARLTRSEIVNDIWDEILTAATHNISTSAGRRLRQLTDVVVIGGTSPDSGGTANTSIRIELDGDASSVDGTYDPAVIFIASGTGMGQSRQIWEYDGSNKFAYVNRDWKVIPDNTSVYIILTDSGNTHVNEGLATGGGVSTITLNSLASSDTDAYVGQLVFIAAGVGSDQAGLITAYNGTSKIATVEVAWVTQPTVGSIYAILPTHVHTLAEINAEVDTALSDYNGPTEAEMNTAHALLATVAKQDTIDGIVDAILEDVTGINGAAMRGTDSAATEIKQDIMQGNVTDILTDTDTTIPAQLDTMSGTTFNTATDSLEAIRNRGDAAWTSGASASLTTDVATSNTTTSFTLTAGTPSSTAYPDMQVTVTDANGDGSIETRRIASWTAGRVITVDTAFSFTPAVGDVVVIERAYLGVSVSGGDATLANQEIIKDGMRLQ